MRFIFLTPGYHPDIDGSAYRYAAEVADLLSTRGHEVHVVTKNRERRLSDVELRRSVRIYRVDGDDSGPRSNWRSVNRDIRYRIKQLLHDSNHATLIASHHAYFSPAIRGYGTVSLLHGPWRLEYLSRADSHDASFFTKLKTRWISRTLHRVERRALDSTRSILVASQHAKSALQQWHPGLSTPVQSVGAGANTRKFFPAQNRTQVRESMGIQPDQCLLLTVRRLERRTGLHLLMDAFKAVASLHPGAQLWIAGRGSQHEALAAQIRQTGLGDRIRLLGFVSEQDLPSYYNAADAMVMPSIEQEGFGLSAAEAMACGTPVLASRKGANVEVAGKLAPELLFDLGVEPLASLLKRVLTRELPLPDRTKVATHAVESFRWDTAADALENAWHEFALDPEIPKRK